MGHYADRVAELAHNLNGLSDDYNEMKKDNEDLVKELDALEVKSQPYFLCSKDLFMNVSKERVFTKGKICLNS